MDEDGELSDEKESQLVYGLGGLLFGGLDTVNSLQGLTVPFDCFQSMVVTLVFLLFMVRHPEIQQKARREIDGVVGSDRLPTIDDRDKLPYVRSILTEALRICPPVPNGKRCSSEYSDRPTVRF